MKPQPWSATLGAIFFGLGSLFLFSGRLSAQENAAEFRRLTIEDGLSQSSIYCLFQDNRGFIWLGTEDGLDRYDGYNFKVYKNRTKDPASLSYNYVRAIIQDRSGTMWFGTYGGGLNSFDIDQDTFKSFRYDLNDPSTLSSDFITSISEDPSGLLWIGTDNGLNKFDPQSGKAVRYYADPDLAKGLGHKNVLSVYADSKGLVWIGTYGGGLDKFDPGQGRFTCFKNDPRDPSSLSQNMVRVIYEDRAGALWIGTESGLNKMDKDTGRCVRYGRNSGPGNGLSSDFIYSFLETKKGDLWIGTANGVNVWDRKTGDLKVFTHDPDDPISLSNNEILSLFEDRSGVLWVGTRVSLDMCDQERKPFYHYKHDPSNPYSLGDNYIRAIYEDRTGALWVGGYAGLNRYDTKQKRFYHYVNNPRDPLSLTDDKIMSICEDDSGTLWIGARGGLNRFNRDKDTFTRYHANPSDVQSLSSDIVRVIYKDSSGTMWLGTEDGLNVLDPKAGTFTHYFNDPGNPNSLCNNYIYALTEDRTGALWVGTINGLSKLDEKTGRFTRFFSDAKEPRSLSNSEILSLFVDHAGTLWVGTTGGLNKFDPVSQTFISYLEKDGLPNEMIYSILEDHQNNLWMSTNRGLSRFDPQTGKFRNYDIKDGLQDNEFMLGSCFNSREGMMYFGGINGFSAFRPEKIIDNPFIPPVLITDFLISNKSVQIGKRLGENIILTKAITQTREIKLSYKESFISFEFAALNFINSDKNKYAYQMEGFDKDWIDAGTRRFVTYTNLPPRSYTFRVVGSNNDGIWNNEGASIRIVIAPPFWQTWWFRASAILFILIVILSVYRVRTVAIRETARKLEKRVKERTAELVSTNENLHKEITERERTEDALRISEEKYRSLANQIPVGVYRTALDGKYLYANPALAAILDYDNVEDLMKTPVEDAFFSPQDRQEELVRWKTNPGAVTNEIRLKTKKGRQILVRDTGRLISSGEGGGMEYIDGILEDITEAKRTEELIRSALKEKEVLLKEIHHRVKNNMQIISSLLRLQSMSLKDEQMTDIFNTSQTRIRSMALVHEGLYQSADLASINFSEYLAKLTTHLFTVFRIDPQIIKLHLDVQDILLDVNKAIPCGLIVNELVTNALKHAFPGARAGEILIRMEKTAEGTYTLVIKDTGVGYPKDSDFRETPSLGMQIVTDLVEQLDGTIDMNRNGGTEFIIRFLDKISCGF